MIPYVKHLVMLLLFSAVQNGTAAETTTIPHDLRVPDAMRIKRVVSGPDGKSRVEIIELPIAASESGKSLISRLYSTDVELGYSLPGSFIDWHKVTTPRLFIVLQGAWEFGTGDGKLHLLKAGDIALAADTTGQGHTSRNVGDQPSFVLTVRLPAKDPLKLKPNNVPVK
jgi:gentisate 1,2-dioxygenase